MQRINGLLLGLNSYGSGSGGRRSNKAAAWRRRGAHATTSGRRHKRNLNID
jgi:hypothetical protein